MEKRVLLVSDHKGFMINAIQKGLEREEFEVIPMKPNINELSRMENRPTLILLYLDSLPDRDFLIYLKDIINEDGKETMLYPIGSEDELADLYEIVAPELTGGAFKRPINVNELATVLEEALEKQGESADRRKILVVDDDGTMLRTLKLWLSSKYRVYIANSGMAAVTFLAKNSVDLILLDYEMPVANGPTVLEMLRSEPQTKDIPVMFLTAKGDKNSVMSVVGLRPEKYLLKTMSSRELISNIDEFFEKRSLM